MSRADEIAVIAARFRIVLLVRFGSSVSGRMHARSDIDLGVLLEREPPGFDEFGELLHALQQIFPEREVDLAILDTADPLFLKKVTESCELLFGSPRRLAELRIHAFKRYQDHRRFLAMEQRYVERVLDRMAPR